MASTPRITHIALHVADLDACVAVRFCATDIVHPRAVGQQRIRWLAEPGRESDFIFVMMSGGGDLQLPASDYRRFGCALTSRAAVDAIADAGRLAGCLVWPPRESSPVGYYCGLRDPNGNFVEFSYGQPRGRGAPALVPAARS